MSDLTILIVGGYGTFGARLVQLLEDDARLKLIVAGRSLEKAQAFCASRGAAPLLPAEFDRNGDVTASLAALRPDIVVDCSGPFQAYGEHPYRLIEGCVAAGVHYLDLADGSDFVAGVSAFDEAARAKGLFVLSGASSFPVLTAAAVRALSHDMARVDGITGGIAPSPYAGVGENVIRAIASYAGQRAARVRDGKRSDGHPFTEQRRRTIAPPGREPLENRLFSLVDVPDLRALSQLWPEARDIWMGAAPVPEILHRILIACAWLVRWRVIPSLSPLAPTMHWATNRFRWGAHRGGMFVSVRGVGIDGAPQTRSWHLLAEGGDGPLIPSMAVAAIVRKMLDGQRPAPGARAAVRELELEDYAREFQKRAIYTGLRDDAPPSETPLYWRLLGAAWDALPPAIRAMHVAPSARGEARVTRGRNPIAGIVAAVVGFPRAGDRIPLSVRFDAKDGAETWTRTFGAASFSSHQCEGAGRNAHLLVERFGPLCFAMALVLENDKVLLKLLRWSVLGVPLPLWLAPRSESYEFVDDGRFRFHVEIGHPLCGCIVKYEGWLMPEATRGAVRAATEAA